MSIGADSLNLQESEVLVLGCEDFERQRFTLHELAVYFGHRRRNRQFASSFWGEHIAENSAIPNDSCHLVAFNADLLRVLRLRTAGFDVEIVEAFQLRRRRILHVVYGDLVEDRLAFIDARL